MLATLLVVGRSAWISTFDDALIPLARLHLTGADWDAIDAAFLGHTDPLLGAERAAEYQELFRRIGELAPPPVGKVSSR